MKNIFWKIGLVVLVLAAPIKGKADSELPIPGIAESIGWVIDLVWGRTTITPSYALFTWDYYSKYQIDDDSTKDMPFTSRMKVRYDIYFKQTFYEDHEVDPEWQTDVTSTNAFALTPNGVAQWNYNCVVPGSPPPPGYTGPSGTEKAMAVQTYSIVVTCSQASTGLIVPPGPFQVNFKTMGNPIGEDCTSTPTGSRRFGKTVDVMPYGYVTDTVGFPSYSFAFPFQCWAGDNPYEY